MTLTARERLRAYRAARVAVGPWGGAQAVITDLERCDMRHGKATPSVEGIAARCRVSPRTVIRVTRHLEACGRLVVVRRRPFCDSTGRWRRTQTNLYVIRFPTDPPTRNPWSHRGDTGVTSIAPTESGTAPNGAAVPPIAADPDPPPDDQPAPDPDPAPDHPTQPPDWLRKRVEELPSRPGRR